MVKSTLLACLLTFSAPSAALCENGNMTSLLKPVEFQYKEANGSVLRMSLPAGSEVHIVSLDAAKVLLLGHGDFQGQRLAMLGELDFANIKSLRCSE